MNSFSTSFRRTFAALSVLLVVSGLAGAVGSPTLQRTQLISSVKAVPAELVSGAPLTAAEMSAPMRFMVPLKMRNFAELNARIARREIVSPNEMQSRYYPRTEDYQAVVAWLKSEGFEIEKTDVNNLGVFASGPAALVQSSFGVEMGRVLVNNKAYTSALSSPSVPASVAPVILGVNGLQPHIQPHKHSIIRKSAAPKRAQANSPSAPTPQIASQPPFLVSEILKAYGGSNLTVNGAGQKIAIVIDTFADDADMVQFWADNGINQSLSNVEKVQVVAGTLPDLSGEESLDEQWTSGIASGAKIRVYAASDLSFENIDQCFLAILADIPTQPDMHQVSISLGLGEKLLDPSQITTDAQLFAAMAAQGVSVLVSSGDSGSQEGGQLQVSYFASDPNVTAVGGTSLALSNCTGVIVDERAWNGSGGGVSSIFDRPSWQAGPTLPAGSKRLVPDIASAADPDTGALVVVGGEEFQIGGTSWSAPTWAGFCALINQARAAIPLPPIGLLGPSVYPLQGTAAFHDIVAGDNGAFTAVVGYDEATGIGSPNLAQLITPLTGGPTPPIVVVPPAGANAVLTTPASDCPLAASTVTFEWVPGSGTSAYLLQVGTTGIGSSNLFTSGQTGGLSFIVPNLPTDGRTIYARLWSAKNGAWLNPPQDYTFTAKLGNVATPVIAPGSGQYKKKVTVNMASSTPGATIFYTTDNTLPSTASKKFTGPFTLTKSGTVRALATKAGVPSSAITAAAYTISKK